MNDIMYQFAFTQNKVLIDIETLTKENKHENEYICLSCGEKLVPKLGNTKAHHFAHYPDNNNFCSRETYLHYLGKIIFYRQYNECIEKKVPFNIEYEFEKECRCYYKKYKKSCIYLSKEIYNIAEYFPQIKYQKKEDGFIPDLLLIDKQNKDKLFIEIFVTHSISEEKMNSGNRIIEISIKDEKDINPIVQKFLSFKDPMIKFYNFQKKILEGNCAGQCKVKNKVLYVDNDGCINTEELTLSELENLNIKEYYFLQEKDVVDNDFIKMFSLKCSKKKIQVKNCNLCKYHMPDKFKQKKDQPIFCKLQSFICSSFEAEDCKSFNWYY